MVKRPVSKEFFSLMAVKFRMLGDPTRLAIIHSLIEKRELNVGQIVAATKQEIANVSKHLKQLAESGLITRHKKGSYVLYNFNDPLVEQICMLACELLRDEFESQSKRSRKLLRSKKERAVAFLMLSSHALVVRFDAHISKLEPTAGRVSGDNYCRREKIHAQVCCYPGQLLNS
jgi:DNA-binding transcriptional ArsR family regulator